MTNAVAHRGPDGAGYCFWTAGDERVQSIVDPADPRDEQWVTAALGHRRLSILDLSDAGAQPMQAEDGKYVIVFNGEIFNYLELRSVLRQQGHVFRSDSDTEVALHAYMEWGTDCFSMFNGMWAMAIIDVPGDRVVLSRDRLGIKPLYLHCSDGRLAFFSEIKQGLTLPWISRRADMHNVIEFIDTGYQSPSSTFFMDVHVHAPGTFSEYGFRDATLRCTTRYWPAENIQYNQIGEGDLQEQLSALFQDSVKIRLRADVSVGISLSGGLDSSSIYATVRTLKDDGAPYAFSAVYNSEKYDEIPYVDLLMQRNGGEVQQVVVTPEGMLRDLDEFIYHHDEPPGSMSIYASWCVMRQARASGVPVLLNGQGADELFSGYWPAYYLSLARMLRERPWKAAGDLAASMLPGGNIELLRVLPAHMRQYLHRRKGDGRNMLQPHWQVAGRSITDNWAVNSQRLSREEYRAAEVRNVHLPRLLQWEDRNSMAFSIEGRYPFLDYRIVDLAFSIPPDMNMRRGWTKYMLREAFRDLLPEQICWRKEKIGFETPQADWIRSSLAGVLSTWSRSITPALRQIIDSGNLVEHVATKTARRSISRMDEHQKRVIRLFMLDTWIRVFRVEF